MVGVVALTTATALAGFGGAAAAQDDESFTVAPSAIDAGEVLTLVGRNCNGDEARVTVVGESGDVVADIELLVAPTETWAGSIVVPDGIPTGTYEVRALCLSRGIPFGSTLVEDVEISGDDVLPRTEEDSSTDAATPSTASSSTTSTSTTSTSTTSTTEVPEIVVTIDPDPSDVSQVDAPATDVGATGTSDDSDSDDSDVRVKGASVDADDAELALTGPGETSVLSILALSLVAFGLAVLGAAGFALTRRRPLSASYLMSIGQDN